LSIPVSCDPALSPHAEAIARRIAGPDAKAEAFEQARRIGEAQVELNRLRARRMALVSDPLGDPNYQPLSDPQAFGPAHGVGQSDQGPCAASLCRRDVRGCDKPQTHSKGLKSSR
jgi:hypothetical protein